MKNGMGYDAGEWSMKLDAIAQLVRETANGTNDALMLLALLRQLEQLHREIRDGVFQAHLPDNRQALYSLLKDIEMQGGWPYIERMKLEDVMVKMPVEPAVEANNGNGMEHLTFYSSNQHSTKAES